MPCPAEYNCHFGAAGATTEIEESPPHRLASSRQNPSPLNPLVDRVESLDIARHHSHPSTRDARSICAVAASTSAFTSW
jgi:hypothetical protein